MDWYRVTLTLAGPAGTPWQADTLFGHLCWGLRFQAGEAALRDFLDRYRAGDPPLLLSNGFPEGWLPRPLHAQPPRRSDPDAPEEEQRAAFRLARRLKNIDLITAEDFARVRCGETWQPQPDRVPPRAHPRVALKNQISRVTGTTGDDGRLFGFVEWWPPQEEDSASGRHPLPTVVYCKIAPDFVQDAELLVITLAESGYGKRRSAGYGSIRNAELAPFAGFPDLPEANAFVSLSNFVPSAADPTDGLWHTFVKYGRLGEEFAIGENPFKRPLIMLEAGAVFRDRPLRPWYGRLVPGVSDAHPKVVQYGYALPVPVVWPEEAP